MTVRDVVLQLLTNTPHYRILPSTLILVMLALEVVEWAA